MDGGADKKQNRNKQRHGNKQVMIPCYPSSSCKLSQKLDFLKNVGPLSISHLSEEKSNLWFWRDGTDKKQNRNKRRRRK